MAQFDACVVGGELPVHLTPVGVGGVLPGWEFGVEDVEVADPAIEALPGQRGEFALGDVEPRPVFGRVMDLEALGQGECLFWFECLVQ